MFPERLGNSGTEVHSLRQHFWTRCAGSRSLSMKADPPTKATYILQN